MNKIILALLVTVFIGLGCEDAKQGNINSGKIHYDNMGRPYLILSNGCKLIGNQPIIYPLY